MMQPIMQIGVTVFMARTMDAMALEIKREKGVAPQPPLNRLYRLWSPGGEALVKPDRRATLLHG